MVHRRTLFDMDLEGRRNGGHPDVRVLVVEDDDDARAVLLAMLRKIFGVFAQGARNGEEGLQELFALHPHLILCDLQMPRLDGFGFVRRLRRDPKFGRTPTIAVTGLGHPVDVAAAQEAGFDGHVVKPITASTLARLLDRAWDSREAGDSPEDVA
jgi:two-component system, chemotaxis family, CheB/CheR fusion protein